MDRKIIVCATDLPVITGHNTYKSKDEIILKYWKRHFKADYLDSIEKMKEDKVELKREETYIQTVKRIATEHNITIDKNLSACFKSDNITHLNKSKEKVFDSLSKLSESQKKEFKDSFNSLTNTNFGIKYENKGGELYEKMTGNKIIKTNEFYKSDLFIIPNEYEKTDYWIIGGKLDGLLLPENTIIEIKNRVNRLFYKLRDYEKVQCYTYMYLLNSFNTELIEVLKKKEDNSINIIKVPFETDFWENEILAKLEEFINEFYDFLESPLKKMNLLKLE